MICDGCATSADHPVPLREERDDSLPYRWELEGYVHNPSKCRDGYPDPISGYGSGRYCACQHRPNPHPSWTSE